MKPSESPSALSSFSVRFVVAVFGGALIGLVIGVVVAAIYDGPQNPFAVMPWTIMAAALFLPLSDAYRQAGQQTRGGSPSPEDHEA